MFLTAFSQLVSRICHPYPDVFKHLKTIIVYMLLVYSQQSLWMLMPVYKVSFLATTLASKRFWVYVYKHFECFLTLRR